MKLSADDLVTVIVALKDVQDKYFNDYHAAMDSRQLSKAELAKEKASAAKALLQKIQLSS